MKPFQRAKVSIIVPFHGQYEKVTKLLKSIVIATNSNPYEICLVDDASPNKQFIKKVEGTPQIKVIRSEKQLGYGGALKLGYDNTKQPWVVFLNSDCCVTTPNWLINLGKTLIELKDQNVKMVSSRMDNQGAYTSKLHSESNIISKHSILNENDGPLPLISVMCHRDLFNHIGGFVKNYPLGYEEEELSARMRIFGYKQAISGTSWIHHDGSATLKQLHEENPEKFNKNMEISREMCIKDMQLHGQLQAQLKNKRKR